MNRYMWLVMMFLAYLTLATGPAPAINIPIPSFRYGSLEPDPEVTRAFQNSVVLPDYAYYIAGEGDIPHAIIGIHKDYSLRRSFWHKVDLTPPVLRGWVYQMDMIYGYPPSGYDILDDNGTKVGVWYSSKPWTTVVIEKDKTISVLAPEPPRFRGGR
jgi:hypothetical protein